MHITIVGKFPPLQGGTSGYVLWLAYRLAEQGVAVSVVSTGDYGGAAFCSFIDDQDWKDLRSRFTHFRDVEILPIPSEYEWASSIPVSDCLVSRLASSVIQTVRHRNSHLIIGAYLEPYGVAAYLASKVTHVPYTLIHAGSDISRLAFLSSRDSVYSAIMSEAENVVSTRASGRMALSAGASVWTLITSRPVLEPEGLYSPDGPSLDIGELRRRAGSSHYAVRGGHALEEGLADIPVIGMYGKNGPRKGMSELIAACAELRRSGRKFGVLIASNVCGDRGHNLLRAIQKAKLNDCVCIVPFLPAWKIPEFLRACSVVCFLEQDFAVNAHRPQVPREIAMSERCLVVSRDVARHQDVQTPLVDGENVVIVDDYRDLKSLVSALDPLILSDTLAQSIAEAGRRTFRYPSDELAREWVSQLLQSVPVRTRREMTIGRFQEQLIGLYGDAKVREHWSTGGPSQEKFFDISQSERETLMLLAKLPEVSNFSKNLLRKRWGFFDRRFVEVFRHYPILREEAMRHFMATWRFVDEPLIDQVEQFVGILRSLWNNSLEGTHSAIFEARVSLAQATTQVLLGNRAQASDQCETRRGSLPLTYDDLLIVPESNVLVILSANIFEEKPVVAPCYLAVVPDSQSLTTRMVKLSEYLFQALRELSGSSCVVKNLINALVSSETTNGRRGSVESVALLSLEYLVERDVVVIIDRP